MASAALQYDNKAAFNRNWDKYLNRPLFPPELELLRLYKDRWPETNVLDLGVGAGRTALTFSILAKSYVGIDYAPRMIEVCQSLIRESEAVQFVVCDATDLSRFYHRRFDLILFSFNGIDCVSHDQRLKVLGEVRKLLAPDGYFFFSSHSLHVFPFRLQLPRKGDVSHFRWAYRCCRRLVWFLQQKWFNRGVRATEARKQGHALLADGEHGFGCRFYYALPEFQVKQLDAAGFDVVTVYDHAGRSVDWRTPTDDTWLHYLCRARNG